MHVDKNVILQEARKVRRATMRRVYPWSAGDATGECLKSSYSLFHKLREHYPNETYLCGNYCHAFVICGSYVVDVTATQFSPKYRPVELRAVEETAGVEFWELGFKSSNENLIRRYFNGWLTEQQPRWRDDV